MVILGYDVSLIFPNSFLSAIVKELLSLNIILGFMGVYFIFLVLLLLASPLFLLPIRIARKKRIYLRNKVLLLNLLGFTGVTWIAALFLALRLPGEVVKNDT